jgi:hypothetical protein
MLAALIARLRQELENTEPVTRLLAGALTLAVMVAVIGTFSRLRPDVFMAVEGTLFFVITAAALMRSKQEPGVIAILLGALGFYFVYLGYTSFGERNYDGGPQLEYVQYIWDHGKRPPASQCLICHHPPLYYATGALVYGFCKKTHLLDPAVGLQVFGLVLFMFFLAYAARTAQLLLKDKRAVRLAVALVAFWPYSVHNCCRLHNDTMATAFMGIAGFYVLRFWQEDRQKDLFLGALFTGLALLTKSSAYALVPVLLLAIAVRFFRSRDRLRALARGVFAVAILGGALTLNARGKESPTSKNAPLCHKILGNACDIDRGQFVPNEVGNYLYLDLKSFMEEPYALANRDGSGRQYFWNHLLKSSLFGTHNTIPDRETAYEFNRVIAGILNAMLLGMVGFMILGALSVDKSVLRRWGIVGLSLLSCIGFMVGFRALIPAPHHVDFRHIYQAVILTSAVFAATVAYFQKKERLLGSIGYVLGWGFVALTIFYFFPKHDLAIRLTQRVVHRELAAWSKPVPEGTPWDKESNLVIEENHHVEFSVAGRPTANELDITVDNNDRYEIEIEGDTKRVIVVGPATRKVTGLIRYTEKIEPPVRAVRIVRLRALSGDMAYTMGHLILR